MNKKGFTLVEILAVIVIISIVSILLFPKFTSIIKGSKKEISKTNVYGVLSAAYDWSLDNSILLPTEANRSITINLLTLKQQGYLKKDAVNIDTNEEFDNSCIVRITKLNYDGDTFEEVENGKYYGNFLYKLEC